MEQGAVAQKGFARLVIPNFEVLRAFDVEGSARFGRDGDFLGVTEALPLQPFQAGWSLCTREVPVWAVRGKVPRSSEATARPQRGFE